MNPPSAILNINFCVCEIGRWPLFSGGPTITAGLGGSSGDSVPFSLVLSSSPLEGDDSFDVFGLLSVLLVSSNLIALFEESDSGTGVFESDSGTGTQGSDSAMGVLVVDSDVSIFGTQGSDSAMGVLVVDSDVSIFSSVPPSDGCTTVGAGVGAGGSEGGLVG